MSIFTALDFETAQHGLALRHHDALSNARACARLYLMAHEQRKSAAAV